MTHHRIIAIHGLNNKPVKQKLERWWLEAIREGLARNAGQAGAEIDLDMVYWADVLNTSPLDPDPEPYIAAGGDGPLPRHDATRADSLREMAQGALDKLTAIPKFDVVTQEVMSRSTPDLHRYFSDPAIRERLREKLESALEAAARDRRRIMIIAHSMGSIIAFDVLASMSRARSPIRIEHLVSLGSPLGLHEVKQQAREQGLALTVPDVVEHWTNLADRRDRIAFDSRLSTDYAPNAGGAAITDLLVVNGYVRPNGKANPHKIYGYLRTPEMSDIVRRYIAV